MPTVAEALQIGWRRHQAGDLPGAEQIYRRVLQAAPRDENAWCFLGMACHDQARYEEALTAYHQALERRGEFGAPFIELARGVYRQNDRRAAIKRAINELLGSRYVEEKSYPRYDAS